MSIFKKCVPYVAFWVPTGEERTIKCEIEIVSSQFGHSAKFVHAGLLCYVLVAPELKVNAGETYKSVKIVQRARTGYALDDNNELYVAPPKPDAPKIWRAVELHN